MHSAASASHSRRWGWTSHEDSSRRLRRLPRAHRRLRPRCPRARRDGGGGPPHRGGGPPARRAGRGAPPRHIEVCADCAAEHDRLELIPDLLDLAGAAEPAYERPPAQLEDAILARFAREPPQEHTPRGSGARDRLAAFGRQLRRPLPAAAAGALAAAAIAAAIVIPGGGGAGQYATAPG